MNPPSPFIPIYVNGDLNVWKQGPQDYFQVRRNSFKIDHDLLYEL